MTDITDSWLQTSLYTLVLLLSASHATARQVKQPPRPRVWSETIPHHTGVEVITVVSKVTPLLHRTLHSCPYNVTVLIGTPWQGFQTKLNVLLVHLRKPEVIDKIVMIVDGYDILFVPQACPTNLIASFLSYGKDLILSGEQGCYPDGFLEDLYPPSTTIFRFVNAGGMIGRARAILYFLERDYVDKYPDGVDDQRLWSDIFLSQNAITEQPEEHEGEPTIGLDYNGQFFTPMFRMGLDEFEVSDVVNVRRFNHTTCILHGNGIEAKDVLTDVFKKNPETFRYRPPTAERVKQVRLHIMQA